MLHCSLGTLGGGNHFLELDKGNDGTVYLVIHTGSRNLGLQLANYYQSLAVSLSDDVPLRIDEAINRLKREGRETGISAEIARIKKERRPFNKDLACLTGEAAEDYLHDIRLIQKWAEANRRQIASIIMEKAFGISLDSCDSFQTIHNYIDDDGILRKGAVRAGCDTPLLIPLNMRDGSLICVGKMNPEWNCSAPHGAGRIMSRAQAKKNLDVSAFVQSMSGIYTTTADASTLDEAPFAYKSPDDIISNIKESVCITQHIKPIYNFKASGD